MNRPRILLYDVETSPLVVTVWGLFKPRPTHDNIRQESTLISAAWKWLGEKEVYSAAVNPRNPLNDKPLIRSILKVLAEADVIVAHNGDKFDRRKINARAIYHGFKPLPYIQMVDTLKVARKIFSFNSNRLDYLGKFLCGEGKIKTDYDLWLKVMDKDADALAQMVEYNKGDVTLLEKVYLKLRPYMINHPNVALYRGEACCPNCGSKHYQHRGTRYRETVKYKRYRCMDVECGKWFSGKSEGRVEVKG